MHPFSADSTCQTENLIDGGDATGEGAGFHQPLRISRLEAKLVEVGDDFGCSTALTLKR